MHHTSTKTMNVIIQTDTLPDNTILKWSTLFIPFTKWFIIVSRINSLILTSSLLELKEEKYSINFAVSNHMAITA